MVRAPWTWFGVGMRVRRPGRPLARTVIAAGAAAVLLPAAAAAHGTGADHHPTGSSAAGAASRAGAGAPAVALRGAAARTEARLHAEETATLGAQHAAEHAAERAALRAWAARPAAERDRLEARGRRAATRATAAAGPADEVGRWATSTIGLPTWAINAVVLPTGKVAYWGRGALESDGNRRNTAPFYVLDPDTGVSKHLDPPQETIDLDGDGQADDVAPAPIFCSGQSLLPSGELFVAGGNAFYPFYGAGHADYGGYAGTYSFDPWTERWTTQPRMRHGRWYPTQAALPDGRTAIVSGYDEQGDGEDNADLEVFTPGATRGAKGTLKRYAAGERTTEGFYPHMQTLPGGLVAFVGQFRGDARTLEPAALDQGRQPWVTFPGTIAAGRVGGASALLPGTSRMMVVGGYGADWDTAPADRVFAPATRMTESLDFASAAPSWQTGTAGLPPDLNRARSYGSLVQLPDGGFAYVGGAAGYDDAADGAGNNAVAAKVTTPGDQALKTVELWRPGQSAWRVGPAQAKWRGYHSTAVLLPDGRVLSAGDDFWGPDDTPHRAPVAAGADQDRGEVYEPAYLFDGEQKAPRPTITSGPSAVRWGAPFGVGVEEVAGRPIVRATLVAPSAVTHSVDMNRAFVDLPIQRVPGRGVDLVGPSGADVAPPGWYMLFAWDDHGTPSVARWVQVRGDAPDAPVLADPATPDPTPGGADGGGTADGGTTPVATPPPGDPVPGPVAKDTRGPRASLAVRRVGRRTTTLRVRVGADEPGKIVLRLQAGRDRAQTRTIRLPSSRLGTLLRVRLGTRARRTLRAGRTLRIVLRTTSTDGAGNVARRTVVVRMRPRR
jgi:hypothetical protein